ncbi:MAG: RteC domain-containing protein [Flavisolibacter sp.]
MESAFQKCYQLWSEMQHEINAAELDTKDLITLNKSVRSELLSRIEYYVLHYHALLFRPCGKKALSQFWYRESLRLEKFQKEHTGFYHYYRSAQVHLDAYYYGHLSIDFADPSCGTFILLVAARLSFSIWKESTTCSLR